MEAIFRGLLLAHVMSGLLALGWFWAALAQRKGSDRHRRLGRTYLALMVFSMATALVLAAMVVSWPLAIHPLDGAGLDEAAIAKHVGEVTEFALFLAEIGMMTLTLLWVGARAVLGSRARSRGRSVIDYAAPIGFLGVAFAALAWVEDGHAALIFGVFATFPLVGQDSARRRLGQHIVGILGSGAAVHTAFIVSIVPRVFPGVYESDPAVNALPWALPPLLGAIGIVYALRRYLPPASPPQLPAHRRMARV